MTKNFTSILLGTLLLGLSSGCVTNRIQQMDKDGEDVYIRTSKATSYIFFAEYDELIHRCTRDQEDDGTPVLECETVDFVVDDKIFEVN